MEATKHELARGLVHLCLKEAIDSDDIKTKKIAAILYSQTTSAIEAKVKVMFAELLDQLAVELENDEECEEIMLSLLKTKLFQIEL